MLRMIAGKLDVQRYTAKTDHCAYPRGTQGLRLQFRLHLVLNKWNAGSGSSWRKEVEGLGNVDIFSWVGIYDGTKNINWKHVEKGETMQQS